MKSLRMFSLALVCLCFLNFNSHKPFTVVIDAGHGGSDSGALVNGVSEKDIVFAISQKIKAKESENLEIILLRQDDRFISLKDRTDKIKSINPNLLLSLHIDNAVKEEKSSTKAYIHKNNQVKESHYYAKNLLKNIDESNTEVLFAGFYILKNANVPAVNLNIGNISNEKDFVFLTSSLGQDYIAEKIVESLQ